MMIIKDMVSICIKRRTSQDSTLVELSPDHQLIKQDSWRMIGEMMTDVDDNFFVYCCQVGGGERSQHCWRESQAGGGQDQVQDEGDGVAGGGQ